MTSTTTPAPAAAVEQYLAAVRACLAGVDETDRDELLDDLEQHLVEVAAEAGGDRLEDQLGTPEAYAADLLATAGLPSGASPRPTWQQLWTSAVAPVHHLRTDPRWAPVRGPLREIAPGWWVLRAYAVVLAVSQVNDPARMHFFPAPRLFGSTILGLAALVGGIGLSWRLGRRARLSGRAALASLLVSVLGVLCAAGIADTVSAQASVIDALYDDQGNEAFGAGGVLHTSSGETVTNIYPYDAKGRPLDGVVLFDQRGLPLDIVVEETDEGFGVVTSFRLDAEGRPVTNAFPQRQVLRPDVLGEETLPFGVPDDVGTPPEIDAPVLETPTP